MPDHPWLAPPARPRDQAGRIRVIAYQADYDRLVQRAFEKIRQCSVGMPAVMIRQLDALCRVMEQTTIPHRREALMEQGAMIWRGCEATVPEPADREDVLRRYEALLALHRAADSPVEAAGMGAPAPLASTAPIST